MYFLYLLFPGFSQTPDYLRTLLGHKIGLKDSEIAKLEQGHAVAKILDSHRPSQILIFGAVYVAADPGKYVRLANDLDRHKLLHGNRATQRFSEPPVASDLSSLVVDANDVKELKKCKPGDCDVQLPSGSIEEFQEKSRLVRAQSGRSDQPSDERDGARSTARLPIRGQCRTWHL